MTGVLKRTGNLLLEFWADETALTVCSEAVVVGTVGVLAATTGLSIAFEAFQEQAVEYGSAVLSLNPSYRVDGYEVVVTDGQGRVQRSTGYAASSSYTRTDAEVKRRVQEYRTRASARIRSQRQQIERAERQALESLRGAASQPGTEREPARESKPQADGGAKAQRPPAPANEPRRDSEVDPQTQGDNRPVAPSAAPSQPFSTAVPSLDPRRPLL